MNRWLVLLLAVFPLRAGAQYGYEELKTWDEDITDSLLSVLPTLSDSSQMWVKYNKSYFWSTSKPDSALHFLNEVRDWAQEENRSWLEGKTERLRGYAFDTQGDTLNALQAYRRSLALFQMLNYEKDIAQGLLSLGVGYYYAGNYPQAINYYNQTVSFCEQHPGNDYAHGLALNNAAALFRVHGDNEKAIETYRKSIALKVAQNDSASASVSWVNMGTAYTNLGQDSMALACYAQAEAYYRAHEGELGVAENQASLRANLANAFLDMKRPQKALEYAQMASEFYAGGADEHMKGTVGVIQVKALNMLSRYREAYPLYPALENYFSQEADGRLNNYMALFQQKHKTLAGLGLYQEAYEAHVKFNQVLGEVDKAELDKEVKRLQTEFDVARKDHELETAELELTAQKQAEADRASRQRLWLGMLALALVSALAIVWVSVRNNRRLAEKNELIATSLAEKEVLLKEIHHRVKNNLQMISSLLSIQARGIDDETALAAVQDSRSRVKSMALIHQNLYQEDHLTGIEMSPYVSKLMTGLISTYTDPSQEVSWEQSIDDLVLDVDTAIPLGLVINELVTNSLKHAFEDTAQPSLRVALHKTSNRLELEVSDNGSGMEPPDWTKPHTSYGMKMLKAFAQKLQAELVVKNDQGTTVRMTMAEFDAL